MPHLIDESSDGDNDIDDDIRREERAKRLAVAQKRATETKAQWAKLLPKFVTLALEAQSDLSHGSLSGLPGSDAIILACACSRCPHCGSADIEEEQTVDVEYVTTRGSVTIPVPVYACSVCDEQFHRSPISVGAFPATPVKSVDLTSAGTGDKPAWLDMRMLELYFHEQYSCPQMSEEGLCKAVNAMPGSPAAVRLQGFLQDVLPEWLRLRERLADPATLGCADYPLRKGLFGCCGACAEAGPEKPLHSVHFDGVFKLKTYAFAAPVQNESGPDAVVCGCRVVPATAPAVDGAALFPKAPNITGTRAFCDYLQDFMRGEAGKEPGANHCANLKAASEESKSKVHLSERGLFGALCSHGFFILGAIMELGERYAFAILLLYVIAKEQQCKVEFAWYDIGCRFGPYLERYIRELEAAGLEADIISCLKDTKSPLPTWHEICHVLSCRATYSSRNFPGAGTGVGDLCEGCWAWLGLFGGRWSHMSRSKKLVILAANLAEWNRKKDVRNPTLSLNLLDFRPWACDQSTKPIVMRPAYPDTKICSMM